MPLDLTCTSEEGPSSLQSDVECIQKCEEVVNKYRRGQLGKTDSILQLRETLLTPTVYLIRRSQLPLESTSVC